MLKSTKVILITAGVLVGTGLIIGGLAMGISRIKYGGLAQMYTADENSAEYIRQTVEISENFDSIKVDQVSSDINILPTDKSKAYVEYTNGPDYENIVEVDGKTLNVRFENRVAWYHKWANVNIGSFFKSDDHVVEPVNVYLPAGKYDEIELETVSGEINVKNDMECEELSLNSVSGSITVDKAMVSGDLKANAISGEVKINDTEAKKLNADTVSGGIRLENVKFKYADMDTTSGDIRLDGYECEETDINTTSGDIDAYVIGEYHVSTDTTSGDVEIEENSASGYPMDIDTTSGDVTIRQK